MRKSKLIKCKICNKTVSSNGNAVFHHFKKHGLSSREYYDQYLKTPDEGVCDVCGKSTPYKNISRGYCRSCSKRCQSQSPEWLKNTTPSRLKADISKQTPEVRAKYSVHSKKMWKENRGKCKAAVVGNLIKACAVAAIANKVYTRVRNLENWKDPIYRKKQIDILMKASVKGKYFSEKCQIEMPFRSSWELRAMEMLEGDKNISKFEYEPVRIPYVAPDGTTHTYIPDFLATRLDDSQFWIEVKPLVHLSNPIVKAKIKALKEYKEDITVEVWTESKLWIEVA